MKKTIALLLAIVFMFSAVNLSVVAADGDEYSSYFVLEQSDYEVTPGNTIMIPVYAVNARIKSCGIDVVFGESFSFSKGSWVSKNLKVARVADPDPDDDGDWIIPTLSTGMDSDAFGAINPAALTYSQEDGMATLNGNVFKLTLKVSADFAGSDTVVIVVKFTDDDHDENPIQIDLPVTLHVHEHDWVLESSTPSTCSVKGTAQYKCSSCGETKTEELELDPEKHGQTETRDAINATCTVDGYTGDTYCADCGAKLSEGEIIAAAGHKFGEWTEVTPATCSAVGIEERACTVCSEKETRTTDIAPDNHAETELKGAVAPTCTEPGYTGDAYCVACGKLITAGQTLEATGHKYGDWETVTAPTEEAKGERKHTCSACNDVAVEAIPELKEENGYTVTVKTEPTVLEEGVKEWVSEEYGTFTTPIAKLDAKLIYVLDSGDYYLYDLNNVQYVMVKKAQNPLPEGVFVRSVKDGSYKTADAENQVVGNKLTLEIGNEIMDEAIIILLGDYTYDGKVASADAVLLLRHTLFPEKFPLNQSGDLNGDVKTSSADAVLLLRHTLFPEKFPLKYPG